MTTLEKDIARYRYKAEMPKFQYYLRKVQNSPPS